MEAELVSRAVAAATSLAAARDLRVDDAVVLHDSNKLGLRLLPCDVFARVALVGLEVAALEVEIAERLAATASPVAALEPRVDPRVFEADGFAVTFWTSYAAATPDRVSPPSTPTRSVVCTRGCEASRSRRRTSWSAPHRLCDWSRTATQPRRSPRPTGSFWEARCRARVDGSTDVGLRSSCCRGPVEFDVAHVPDDVSAHYPDVDLVLLDECRRLVLAMVAAWR